jgi:hypothetical protein
MHGRFSISTGTDARVNLALLAVAFAAGLLTPFSVNVVGTMPLGELVFLAALGAVGTWMLLQRSLPAGLWRSRMFWLLLGSQAIALGGYVLADLYRGSSTNDLLRGWARMVFLAIDLVAVALIFQVDRRGSGAQGFLGFQWGYAAGMALHAVFGEVLFNDYWKFGFAIPVTIAVLLITPLLGFWTTLLSSVGLGVLHMAMDYRSMGAICLLVPAGMALQKFTPRSRLWILPVVAVLGVGAVGWLYFSREAPTSRSSRSDIERTAMLQAAWDGFRRSPVIGHGSWFSKSDVMDEFFAIRFERSILNGVGSFSEADDTGGGIALHSQMLVGLAEGGLLGGCFFIVYTLLVLWALAHCVLWQAWHRWSAIYLLTLTFALWGVAMSPFSGMHRILIAVAAGLSLKLWNEAHARRRPAPWLMSLRAGRRALAGARPVPLGEAAAR